MTYNIGMVSLGCAKNSIDAETMLKILNDEKYNIVTEPEDADIIIINTCAFIESAKQESIDTILEMAEYKNGKCKLLICTGCLAERYNDEILKEMPEVDAIVGAGDYHKIAEVIEACFSGKKVSLYGHKDYSPEGYGRILSTPEYTAYLKISDGCDNNCTFCAIPKIRGKFRSRTVENIVKEAKDLADRGVKELILIAQDTTRYGIDLYGEYKLSYLLEELCKIDGIKWIRVHYFYAEAVTEELISTMSKNEKICHYIDMPIQHINNRILKRMARRTNRDEIIEKINKMRELMPDVCIRTSIIVGFPSETEEEFNELYDFVKDIKFDRMGVFAYSREEDTPASDFDGQLDEEIKEERLNSLMLLQQEISLNKNKEKIGTVTDVLVEGYDCESFLYFGRTKYDSIEVDQTVYFGALEELCEGDIVSVRILDASEYELSGEQII